MTSSAPTHKLVSTVSVAGSSENRGFVPVPRPLFDLALCHDLGKRELRLFLLVIRLTYGCRGNAWAVLRPGDLSVIGIHSSHARLCLRRLMETGLVLRDGDSHRYRAHPKYVLSDEEAEIFSQRQQLKALVGKHIGRSRGRSGTEGLPALTVEIPAQVPETQKATPLKADSGMYDDVPDTDRASQRWRFDRQQHRFQPTSDTAYTGEPSR